MKFFVALLSLLLLISCAPEDRPIKGRYGDRPPIRESGYFGNVYDVGAYAINRIDEIKRLTEIAINPNQIVVPTKDGLNEPFKKNEISCRYNKASKDNPKPSYLIADRLVENEINEGKAETIFRFNNKNCRVYYGDWVSHQQSGEENFKVLRRVKSNKPLTKATINKIAIDSFYYDAPKMKVLLKPKAFLQNKRGFKVNSSDPYKSTHAELIESRDLWVQKRFPQPNNQAEAVLYFFSYSSNVNFSQFLRTSSFEGIEEGGTHELIIEGDMFIKNNKVVLMRDLRFTVDHNSPRQVLKRYSKGKGKPLFFNENNGFKLDMVSESELRLVGRGCRTLEGEFLVERFTNKSDDSRNRFFGNLDFARGLETYFKGGKTYSAFGDKVRMPAIIGEASKQTSECTGKKGKELKLCKEKVAEQLLNNFEENNFVFSAFQSCESRKKHMQSQPYGLVFLR